MNSFFFHLACKMFKLWKQWILLNNFLWYNQQILHSIIFKIIQSRLFYMHNQQLYNKKIKTLMNVLILCWLFKYNHYPTYILYSTVNKINLLWTFVMFLSLCDWCVIFSQLAWFIAGAQFSWLRLAKFPQSTLVAPPLFW